MKRILSTLSLLVFLGGGTGTASASETSVVLPGAPKAEVLRILGEPTGRIGAPGYEIYSFDRGEIVFRNGIVQSQKLISPEELEERQRAEEARREARIRKEAEAREQHREEGLALLEKARTDLQFGLLPAEDRLAFWRTFQRKYPEIDVELDYAIAFRQAKADREAEARRLAEIEREAETAARIRQLEQRVEEAEREAERARARQARDAYRRGGYYYPRSPVVIIQGSSNKNDAPPRDRTPDRQGGGRGRGT